MAVDLSKLHIDSALTSLSVAYTNAEFVASRVCPEVPVQKKSNKYFVYGKDRFRPKEDLRAPGSEPNDIVWDLSSDTYFCDGHALRASLPDEWAENEDVPIDVELDAVTNATESIDLNREINLVNTLKAGMTGSATIDLNATAQRFDDDTKDPVKFIDTQKETVAKAIGRRPNVLLLSRPSFRGLRNNAKVVSRVTGAPQLAPNTMITVEQLRQLLEVDELIVADAAYLTSHEGQADALDFIWGKLALLFYRPPSPGLRTPALGYHFMWDVVKDRTGVSAPAAIQGAVAGRIVKRYRMESRSADIIEVHNYYDQKIVAAGAGVLFTNAVS